MTLRARFTLIAFGTIIFVVAGPVLIFFARGFSYDFTLNKIIKTGTIVIKTDPKGAAVLLSGQVVDTSPVVKRFVVPGEYTLSIKKDGYQPWNKKFTIREQQVLGFPSFDRSPISLFRQTPESSLISASTTDFYIREDELFIMEQSQHTTSTLVSISKMLSGDEPEFVYATSTPLLEDAKIIGLENSRELGARLLVTAQKKSYLITEKYLLPIPTDLTDLKISPDTSVVRGLTHTNELVEISNQPPVKKLLDNVADFTTSGDAIYYIARGTSPHVGRLLKNNTDETVFSGLPNFTNGKVIVAPDKFIFLILDNTLYQVSDSLQKINTGVINATWDISSESLVYSSDNEVWIYNPISSETNTLVTRTAETLSGVIYNAHTNYVFLANGKMIKAIEFDPRFTQANAFDLVDTRTPTPRFFIDSEGLYLYYILGPNLTRLKIR